MSHGTLVQYKQLKQNLICVLQFSFVWLYRIIFKSTKLSFLHTCKYTNVCGKNTLQNLIWPFSVSLFSIKKKKTKTKTFYFSLQASFDLLLSAESKDSQSVDLF